MPVIQNQQTGLLSFISLNGSELTNHNRKHAVTKTMNVSDIEVASGKLRRFYRPSKSIVSVSYLFLPGPTTHTVDGKNGRNFIENLAKTNPYVYVILRDDPSGATTEFYGFLSNYRESIVRRDFAEQVIFYNIDFEIEEQ